jgi:Tol biopolymer transport system component
MLSRPAISPDGSTVLVLQKSTNNPAGNWEMIMMNRDGSETRKFLINSGNAFDPAFNPNGKTVTFVSDHDGAYKLYELNLPQTSSGNTPGAQLLSFLAQQTGSAKPSWDKNGHRSVVVEALWNNQFSENTGTLILRFNANSNLNYRVEQTTDPESRTWETVTNITDLRTNTQIRIEAPIIRSSPGRFFRVVTP